MLFIFSALMYFATRAQGPWTLTVSSDYDTPNPPVGLNSYNDNDSVTCYVSNPVVSGGVGTQYVCTGWSGSGSVPLSGTASSVTFTINEDSSITWNWKTQYYLTVASGYSTPSGSGWYDSGSTAYAGLAAGTVPGGAGTQYVFTSWSGDASGTNYAQSDGITMNGPKTATANWKTQYYLTVSNGGHGTAGGQGWCDANSNAQATITPLTVAGTTGTQYVFAGWTGDASGSGSPSDNILMDGPKTATATWTTQYYLTVGSAYSTPSGSGWYDSGSTAYAGLAAGTVPGGAGTQYVFTSWSGDASGTNYAQSDGITMNGPKTATANWKTQYYLTVTSPHDSPTPVSGWFDSGSSVTESVTSPTPGPSGTQYVATGWTGTGSVPSPGSGTTVTFIVAQPSSITWNWKTQYYLTVSSPYDSPTPLSGWFDSGSSITESVTSPTPGPSGSQYVCTGWSGSGSVPASGTSSSVTFTITAASSITWNWKTQYYLTVSSAYDSPSPLAVGLTPVLA